MASIDFQKVGKVFADGYTAIEGLDLSIEDGELLVLVGPSGCGKSTALRMIAGLEDVTSGDLLIGGMRANDLAPREREIAMVFQSYALYPHLSVRDNIGFGLRVRGMSRSGITRKVEETARLLELEQHLDRKPSKLSGGQKQRVAMGRALVRSPKAFLMDEPLSNLDARLRGQMRSEITRLQKHSGVTTVYVTHDQVEAMTMGDRVAVMRAGKIQQLDEPRTLYDRPANLFVASFIGAPAMNFLKAELRSEGTRMVAEAGAFSVCFDEAALAKRPGLRNSLGGEVLLGIRPEEIMHVDGATGNNCLEARVNFFEDLGASRLMQFELDTSICLVNISTAPDDVDLDAPNLRAIFPGADRSSPGDLHTLAVDPANVHVFDAGTELAIRA